MSYQILQKSIDIMMKQNEERSLQSEKDIFLIHPKFPGVDYYEFHKFQKIIEIGYAESVHANLAQEVTRVFGGE
jgi:predicted acylesterase/phospholipase RssA